MPPPPPRTLPTLGSLLVLLAGLLLPAEALSGQWRVTPVRLELDRQAKTGAVTVHNEGNDPLRVQLKAMEWTQDPEGKDRFRETQDLIVFPKIMEVPPNGQRLVRAGIRVPPAKAEKAYRLFIEEIPAPARESGANVRIAIRFGMPVFAKPPTEEVRGEIGALDLSDGVLRVPVRNPGNVHFRIRSVVVTGKHGTGEPVFTAESDGWYLLSGSGRVHPVKLPAEGCRGSATLEVSVDTDRVPLFSSRSGDPNLCGSVPEGGDEKR